LGTAFLLDAALEVIDNYNMRCQSFVDISPNVLFQAPTSDSFTGHESVMIFLQTTGRAEVLWYPLSDKTWLKVWTVTKCKPGTRRQAAGQDNVLQNELGVIFDPMTHPPFLLLLSL
jgi:Cholesterol oxidase, substrate-binding